MSEPARVMLPDRVPKRRTDHVKDAVLRALEARRMAIDGDGAVRAVTVSVKLKQGTITARAVVVTIEAEETLL